MSPVMSPVKLPIISPETVRSLAIVVSPLNITLKASDLSPAPVPFPITKAVFAVLKVYCSLVTVEPEELYCPITKEAKSLALVFLPTDEE